MDVGLIAGGGVGLMTATTRLHRAIASADVALGLADIAIRDFRHEIVKSQAGRDFLEAWDIASTLITVYGLARAVQQAPGIIRSVRQTFQRLRNAPPPKGLGKIEAHVDDMLQKADEAKTIANQSASKVATGTPTEGKMHNKPGQKSADSIRPNTVAAQPIRKFTTSESLIVQEAKSILAAKAFQLLRNAHLAGKHATVRIGNRVIQYEKNLPS